MYTQCLLIQGNLKHVAWIPAKIAVKNKHVKLKDAGIFRVLETWSSMDGKVLRERQNDYKNTRKTSDI